MPLPKTAFALILFCSLAFNALAQSTFYAASRSGLNMRQDPDGNSAVITKIPYGAKVTKAGDVSSFTLTTEGMSASWQRILYEGRPGYVADVYLLPFEPPSTPGQTDLAAYLRFLSPQVGTSKKITADNGMEGQLTITRILHQNGMCYRSFSGYEYGSETIWLPGITLKQAFVLARLLSPEAGLLSTSDVYPKQSSESDSPSHHSVTLIKPYPNNGWVTGIHYEWCDAGCSQLEIRDEEGEISITISSGV